MVHAEKETQAMSHNPLRYSEKPMRATQNGAELIRPVSVRPDVKRGGCYVLFVVVMLGVILGLYLAPIVR